MPQAVLRELARDLALAVDPQLEFDKVWLDSTRNWVLEELRKDTHAGHQREWHDVKKTLLGLAEKARVRVQDDLADGLSKMIDQMETHQKRGVGDWNDDLPLKSRNLAQHVQLLLNLASPASSASHAAAYELLHRQAPTGPTADELLYAEIMRERFTGDHWGKGYNEEVKHGWTDSEAEDEDTSSDEEIITPHRQQGPVGLGTAGTRKMLEREEAEWRLHEARRALQSLDRRAYWKHPRALEEAVPEGLNGWRAVSTEIGALALSESFSNRRSEIKVISAAQLQREMLFALSNRQGVFFEPSQSDAAIALIPWQEVPLVRHLSEKALEAILQQVELRTQQLQRIRSCARNNHASQTSQAFAECCRQVVSDFGMWIGEMEQAIVIGAPPTSGQTASTPLQLLRAFEIAHGDLIDHLENYLSLVDQPILLLDAIARTLDTASHKTAIALRSIWLRTAEPIWGMLRDWLVRGMPVPAFLLDSDSNSEDERTLPAEFFIERAEDVEWGDEDFWESAYVSREEGWPVWLDGGDLREMIVEAGKARGLLMALGEKPSLPVPWTNLEALIRDPKSGEPHGGEGILEGISRVVAEHVSPICALATFQLRRVLDDECGLLSHLDAIEGFLYMRHFPVIADWTQWLFKQIGDGSRWSDFHLLTGTLRDCIEQNHAEWLNAPAIRVTTVRSPRGMAPELSGVRASYQVPFPLSQIFSSTSMELRSEMFTFLLRLIQARSGLQSGFKDLSKLDACEASSEERAARSLRLRVSWLLETLWSWINNIIAIETKRYRDLLVSTTSVKAMIALELQQRVRDFCFLHDHATNARDAIHAIMSGAQWISSAQKTGATFEELQIHNADLASHVDNLREEVEELVGAGEPGPLGAEARMGWSMLAVALQDWR